MLCPSDKQEVGSLMKFHEKLLEIRKKQGLSQEELGMELQVSRQTISKWESGVSHSSRYHTRYNNATLIYTHIEKTSSVKY